jgi:hypothetical protein
MYDLFFLPQNWSRNLTSLFKLANGPNEPRAVGDDYLGHSARRLHLEVSRLRLINSTRDQWEAFKLKHLCKKLLHRLHGGHGGCFVVAQMRPPFDTLIVHRERRVGLGVDNEPPIAFSQLAITSRLRFRHVEGLRLVLTGDVVVGMVSPGYSVNVASTPDARSRST